MSNNEINRRHFFSAIAAASTGVAISGYTPVFAKPNDAVVQSNDSVVRPVSDRNGKIFIWMQMLGFDRNDPDRGANRFLEQTGFLPDGVIPLLFHPDFVHQHRGMTEEYELPADNCAYYGIPGNIERQRQPWTNYNLRDLASHLSERGVGMYAGIMGVAIGDTHHNEWINDHPEIRRHGRNGGRSWHHVLKRFADGSWYEDFFVEKLCQTLIDYGFRGVHLSDQFCPNMNIYHGDYSTDMVTQFLDHTGLTLSAEIAAGLGNDTAEVANAREDWVWKNVRAPWIEFLCWRWERFFEKICSRVHAVGCEVMVLGMYCTDPFETKYCLGTDMSRLMKAGVDYLTANILPASVYLERQWETEDDLFQRYMAIIPTTAAHLRGGHLVSMLGLQDASEEWNVMKHMPCLHERDLYTMMAYQMADKKGLHRALEGYFLCLGDGIPHADWEWEYERLKIALSADVDRVLSPSMIWSDTAYEKMLDEYIRTRRWTPHKMFYELGKAGTMCGGCVRSEALDTYEGTLFVPDFDMLSPEEQIRVAKYNKGAVICTAPAGFDPSVHGIHLTIMFTDRFSNRPMTVFAFGATPSPATAKKIETLLGQDDGKRYYEGEPADAPEYTYTLIGTLPFSKIGSGLRDALALLLREMSGHGIICDKPYLAYRLTSGAYRLYLFNNENDRYNLATVKIGTQCWLARNEVSFPVVLTFRLDNPVEADRLELVQTAWDTGDYRTSDVVVETLDGADWKELGTLRLENRANAFGSLALSNPKNIKAFRLRIIGTHDTNGARSVGLGGLRLFNGNKRIDLSGAEAETSSSFSGFSPEVLLNSSTCPPVKGTQVVSSFPILPVRGSNHNFRVKLQPGGVTIVDVLFEYCGGEKN